MWRGGLGCGIFNRKGSTIFFAMDMGTWALEANYEPIFENEVA